MSTKVLIVELRIAAGEREKFLARARVHRKTVLDNEESCRRFDLLTPEDDADVVFLYEVYADADALETHLNTSYMKAYLDDTGAMVAGRKRTLCTLVND